MSLAANRWLSAVPTLALGLAAALLCTVLHTPLPWMIGPLLAVASARMWGADLRAPSQARNAGQWVIGASLGLYFTPDVVARLVEFLPYIVAGSLFALAMGAGGALTTRGPGIYGSSPWMPPYWKIAGTVTTTISTRSECAAATWSMRAPLRSARLAISEAPPMAVEK